MHRRCRPCLNRRHDPPLSPSEAMALQPGGRSGRPDVAPGSRRAGQFRRRDLQLPHAGSRDVAGITRRGAACRATKSSAWTCPTAKRSSRASFGGNCKSRCWNSWSAKSCSCHPRRPTTPPPRAFQAHRSRGSLRRPLLRRAAAHRRRPRVARAGADKLPELRRNGAAVDCELACCRCRAKPVTGRIAARSVRRARTRPALDPTNGLLLVARLDGPSAAIARALGGQGDGGRNQRALGPRLLRPARPDQQDYKKGDDWHPQRLGNHAPFGFETVVDDKPEPSRPPFR